MQGASLVPVVIAAVVSFATHAHADSLLLGSLTGSASGASAPETELRVQIVLVHQSVVAPFRLQLGGGTWWEDEDSGAIDFTSESDEDFDALAARLTDGVDELLHIFVRASNAGVGNGWPESVWVDGSPDLVGNRLDFIRLIVHELSVAPYTSPNGGTEGTQWDVDWTYEFWGNPIPEPTSLSLLGIGALALVRRRGRPTFPTRPR